MSTEFRAQQLILLVDVTVPMGVLTIRPQTLTPAEQESIVRNAVAEASGAASPPPRSYESPQLTDGSAHLFRSPADCGFAYEKS